MDDLYQHQLDVIPSIARGEPVYIGFDPGLGKSRTALEAAKERNVQTLLIVAPASGRYVWERECKKWWPEMPFYMVNGAQSLSALNLSSYGIVLVTYGLLSQKDSTYASVVAKRKDPFHMTVLDEAAYLKNSGANRTKAVLKKMWPKLGYVLPMSGTPAPNHAGELYSILAAHYPKALVGRGGTAVVGGGAVMNEYQFQEAFCKITQKRFGAGRDVRVIEGSKNLADLRTRLSGYMRRVRKEDVLKDLPAIRWDVVPVHVRADINLMPSVPPGLSDEELLKWLSGAGGEHVMRLRRMLGVAKLEGSLEYVDDLLTNLDHSRKVLVFAHHKEVVANLRAGLSAYLPAVVTGETDIRERARMIDRFLTDPVCRVFIGNIQAAGTAITLVGPTCKCSDVVFAEADYSVGNNVQAACRVHRIGQNDAVVARFLTANGTIDDRIQDILARKAQDFDALFN